jgi:hypothetical protein
MTTLPRTLFSLATTPEASCDLAPHAEPRGGTAAVELRGLIDAAMAKSAADLTAGRSVVEASQEMAVLRANLRIARSEEMASACRHGAGAALATVFGLALGSLLLSRRGAS